MTAKREGPHRLRGVSLAIWGRHELYVHSLAALLSDRGAVVRVLDTPDEAVSRRLESRPDVLVLESPFPSELRSLGDGWPPLVVLTDSGEQESLGDAASITGAVVLTKNASSAELSLAIRRALELGKRDVSGALTTRQRQVLALLAAGLDNAQIAARLGISTRTARAHVSGVLERLGVDNRTQAAVMAVTAGLSPPDA